MSSITSQKEPNRKPTMRNTQRYLWRSALLFAAALATLGAATGCANGVDVDETRSNDLPEGVLPTEAEMSAEDDQMTEQIMSQSSELKLQARCTPCQARCDLEFSPGIFRNACYIWCSGSDSAKEACRQLLCSNAPRGWVAALKKICAIVPD